MQCSSKTLYQMFKLSASGPSLYPLAQINESIVWLMTICCMLEHLAQIANRFLAVTLPRFCNPQTTGLKSGMLGSH